LIGLAGLIIIALFLLAIAFGLGRVEERSSFTLPEIVRGLQGIGIGVVGLLGGAYRKDHKEGKD
jgi:hypothetical protein